MINIVIYGMGEIYRTYKEFINQNFFVKAFIDNNEEKKIMEGIPIFSVDTFCHEKFPYRIYITSSKYYAEMKESLLKKGIKEEYIVNGVNEFKSIKRKQQIENDNLAKQILSMENAPLSRMFGMDRGTAIDRVFIEKFLDKNKKLITGDCLEIAENVYTMKYGTDISKSYILHVNGGKGMVKGDLVSGAGIEKEMVDCAILTQTLMFLSDLSSVPQNIYKMLKHGGDALITVSGISQISRFDANRWGHYFSFYPDAMKTLFEPVFGGKNITIQCYGNLKLAMGYLYGMCAEDFEKKVFEENDMDYPLIIGTILHKE